MANGQEPSSDGNGRASSNTELRHSLSHSIHSELGPDSRRPGGQQSTSRPCSPPVLEPTAPPHARGTSREIRLKKLVKLTDHTYGHQQSDKFSI